jgi:hypothetical protein
MKRIGLAFLILILSISSFAQNREIQVNKEVSEYYADTCLFSQIDFHYFNSSDSVLVLWFDKNKTDTLTYNQRIRNHFYIRKGDWSFIQLILDGNVGSFTPSLFDSFMKIIGPEEHFTVSIIKKGKLGIDSEFYEAIERKIVIVNAADIRGLQIDKSIEMFNYQPKSVVINATCLIK